MDVGDEDGIEVRLMGWQENHVVFGLREYLSDLVKTTLVDNDLIVDSLPQLAENIEKRSYSNRSNN